MQMIEEKYVAGASHSGDPGAAARSIFESFDFGDLEVLDFDGADSVVGPGEVSSTIRFYVAPESGVGDSVPMLFRVDFGEGGAMVRVYG